MLQSSDNDRGQTPVRRHCHPGCARSYGCCRDGGSAVLGFDDDDSVGVRRRLRPRLSELFGLVFFILALFLFRARFAFRASGADDALAFDRWNAAVVRLPAASSSAGSSPDGGGLLTRCSTAFSSGWSPSSCRARRQRVLVGDCSRYSSRAGASHRCGDRRVNSWLYSHVHAISGNDHHRRSTVETVHEDSSWLFTAEDPYGDLEEVVSFPARTASRRG